jgi:hypothetical protein
VGNHGKSTQRQAVAAVWFSEHQELQAVRIAKVLPEEFDAVVDSDRSRRRDHAADRQPLAGR